jgi:hypothetical protein
MDVSSPARTKTRARRGAELEGGKRKADTHGRQTPMRCGGGRQTPTKQKADTDAKRKAEGGRRKADTQGRQTPMRCGRQTLTR